jgi:drug/metabolite transporter (DMT)-like permease
MTSERFAGYFMLTTAVVVAIPVLFQLRAREADWKHSWSPILFILGLAVTGAAYAFSAQNQRSIAIAGVAAMLLGLIFAQRTRKSRPQS